MTGVLVCGGRDYADRETFRAHMDFLHRTGPITEVITGDAKGADYLARQWAFWNRVPCREFKADWKTHGRSAGPIRNRKMLTDGAPDLVVAFPGGNGTEDMVTRARDAGVPVDEITKEAAE